VVSHKGGGGVKIAWKQRAVGMHKGDIFKAGEVCSDCDLACHVDGVLNNARMDQKPYELPFLEAI